MKFRFRRAAQASITSATFGGRNIQIKACGKAYIVTDKLGIVEDQECANYSAAMDFARHIAKIHQDQIYAHVLRH